MPLNETAAVETADNAGSPGDQTAVETTETPTETPAISPDIQSKLDLLASYEESHKFVDQYGGIEGLQSKLELDEAIRSGDADRIHEAIAARNAKAVHGLANKYGSAAAAPVDPAKILSEYLGPNVTNDTLREFRQWRESPTRFENLPPEILYVKNDYGDAVLRADDDPVMILAKQVQDARKSDSVEIQSLRQELARYRNEGQQSTLQQETTAATNRIVEPAKAIAKTIGLSVAPEGETADAKAIREYQLESFHSTAGLRFQNGKQTIDGRTQSGSDWIAELHEHINRGEKVAARELEMKLSRRYRTVCDEVAKVVGQSWTGELQKKSTVTKKATDAVKGSKPAGQPLKTELTIPVGTIGKTNTPEFEQYLLKHPKFAGRPDAARAALAELRAQAAD